MHTCIASLNDNPGSRSTPRLTSLPHLVGMNKMVINSIEKLFVTNDAATILNELDVFHPAAKLVVYGAQRQEEEVSHLTHSLVYQSLTRLYCFIRWEMPLIM